MTVPDPLGFLDEYRNSNRYLNWRPWSEHGASQGHLMQSALTGKITSGFQFDHRWSCETCRPYKQEAEGSRIVEAVEGEEIWLSVVRGERQEAKHLVDKADVDYVVLPIDTGLFAVLTTGALDGHSIQLEDQEEFVRGTIMEMRWEGSISSSRGFLPPARKYRHFETYHKDTRRRCWHLHGSRQEAHECARPLELDGERKGWYVRGCSPDHKVGRVAVYGDVLVEILQTCRLGFVEEQQGDGTTLVLDPVAWTDQRFQQFLRMARWEGDVLGSL